MKGDEKVKKRKVFKNSFYALLFVVLGVVGCKTTPPTLGYIKPSKEILEAYGNGPSVDVPHNGTYLDYGKDGGHTTKRVVFLYSQNGNLVYKGENLGADIIGRISSNAGVFIGAGTAIASPFWGYFGQKTRDANNVNMSGGGGSSSSTATSSSGP